MNEFDKLKDSNKEHEIKLSGDAIMKKAAEAKQKEWDELTKKSAEKLEKEEDEKWDKVKQSLYVGSRREDDDIDWVIDEMRKKYHLPKTL